MGNKNRRRRQLPNVRVYEPKENPISLGEACQKMYQMCWFDTDPIVMIWNDVEIRMQKIQSSH